MAATPTPVPLTLGTISVNCYPLNRQLGTLCGDGHTKINIPGTGFDTGVNANIQIYAFDVTGKQYTADPAYIGGQPTNETVILPSSITAHFSSSLNGTYTIKVVQNGQSITSSNSVLVQ